MGVVRREGVRNTIIYYSGVVLGYFSMVILLPKILHDDQFGLVSVLIPFSAMLAFFYQLGLPNIIVRFFPYLKNKATGHHGILFFSFSVALVSIVISTSVFLLFKQKVFDFFHSHSPLLVQHFYLIFPLAVGITIFEIFNAYNRAQFKTYFATFLNEVYVRILILAIGVLYFFHFIDFQGFIVLYVLSYLSNPVLMLLYTWKNKMLYLKPDKEIFKPELRNKMLNYGAFNFFGGVSGMLMDKLDVIFIPGLINLADTGVYRTAVFLALAVALPARALLNILFPLIADAFKADDKEKLLYLYKASCTIQLFAGGFMFTLIWVNFTSFFTLVHHQFLLGKMAFLFLGIGKLVDMATGINGLLVQNSKYYRYDLAFTLFLIGLTLFTQTTLIPIYGIEGAGIATATAVVGYNIFKFFFVWRMLKMQPFDLQFLKTAITVVSIFLVATFLPPSSKFIPNGGSVIFDMAYQSTIICFLFLMSLVYLKLTPEIYNLVTAVYQRGKNIPRKTLKRFKRKKDID